nr:MAG: RNA-dependent RNA polymerase [Porcine picobirnavirus]
MKKYSKPNVTDKRHLKCLHGRPHLVNNSKSYFENCFDLPNPSLRSYFGRVVNGQPDEYRTPFFGKKPLDDILHGWMSELEEVRDKFPSLYEFEIDLASKVGPMSIMKPLKDRMKDIDAYYDLITLKSEPISQSASDAVLQEWTKAAGLRLRSQRKTVDLMKKSTSSGSPFFTKRRDVTDYTIPCEADYDPVTGKVSQFLHNGKCNYFASAILGWRGQEGGRSASDVKQRVVWMFPYSINVLELQCYQPLIESAQRFGLVPAWISMDAVDQSITKMFDTKGEHDVVICTDFSKFDQHFNINMQRCASYLLRNIFTDTDEMSRWLIDVFPIKYNIPLAYDWDTVRFGAHGMGSGSGGTNADETLVHRALQHEAAMKAGTSLNPYSQCLGDDGVLTFKNIDVDKVIESYSSHGQEMNPDKQYVSLHDCVYLRRWHSDSYRINGVCVGVYSTCRALGRLAEQERYYDPDKWSSKMVALRQLSILENCKYHPLREKFVDYCMKGDKFRLGLDIPGFLDNIEAEAKKAIDYMPDFLGYTKSLQSNDAGIANWWIVKYLKSKR